jgi:pyridoxamine 5'-phosphate oxidase
MPIAPWRSPLARALHRNRSRPESRYLQLATVRPDGKPANRTVVFRGFVENSDQLIFITDRRSDKFPQIIQNPWAEACWYFAKTREQIRLSGIISAITTDSPEPNAPKLRRMIWHQLSDAARSQFLWPTPKQPKQDPTAFLMEPPDPLQPAAEFCLLLLQPLAIDHLELRGEPQNRTLYEWLETTSDWQCTIVNP